MEKLLLVDACLRGAESRTRMLAGEYVSALERHLDLEVTDMHLYDEALAPLTMHQIEQREHPDDDPEEICRYARQFAAADRIVVAAPYWDLSFPSILKVYIEQVSVCGIVFHYLETGQSEGLCRASVLTYVATAGGFIGDYDLGGDYLRGIADLFGIPRVDEIYAEGLDIEGMSIEPQLDIARSRIEELVAYEGKTTA